MKWLLPFIIILCSAPSVFGQAKYQNWCMQGGAQVQTQGQNSTTRVQRSFPSCTITVFNAGTQNLAVIYSDVNKTAMGNPFANQSQATGQYYFYGENGHYDIQIAATGLTTYTLSDVILNDATGGGGGGNVPPACPLSLLAPNVLQGCIDGSGGWAFPQWFGAIPNQATADTSPGINSAIQFCANGNTVNGMGWQVAICNVRLTDGYWYTTNTINLYNTALSKGAAGLQLCGNGKYSTLIAWSGPATASAIRMIGHSQRVCDMYIDSNSAGAGWLDGIQYDGDMAIGVSTAGRIDNVMVDCGSRPGNAISLGRTHYQADQLTIDHPFIISCTSGYGVALMDPNAVGNTLVAPSIHYCWIGMGTLGVTGGQFNIIGGEWDYQDVNFLPAPGTTLNIAGARTEGSKRTVHTSVGGYPQNLTFSNYSLSSTYWQDSLVLGNRPPRPATTATSQDTTHITLSAANSVTWGDWIVVAGAGVGGANLTTHIASMTDPTHAVLDNVALVAMVTNAAVTLDVNHEQNNLSLLGGGPYVVTGGYMGSSAAETAFTVPQGTLVITGVGFRENFANPNPLNIAGTLPLNVVWAGLWYADVPTNKMRDHFDLDPGLPPCGSGCVYPQAFGAKADGVILGGAMGGTGCSGTVGSAAITCVNAQFTPADVGKRFDLAHAGTPACGTSTYGRSDLLMNCNLVGTIASVQSASSLTLSTNVLSAVTNQQFAYASSDDAAVQAALNSGAKTIAFAGTYGITGPSGAGVLGLGSVGGVFINQAVVAPGPGVGRLLRIGPVAMDGLSDAVFIVENGSKYFSMSGVSIWGTNSYGELTTFGPTHDGLMVCTGVPNAAAVCGGLPGNSNGSINDIRFLNCDFSFHFGIGWHQPGTGPEGSNGVYDVHLSHSMATFNSYDGFNPSSSDGMVIDAVTGSYNGTGGMELTAWGSVTLTGSIFTHNKTNGLTFGGFNDATSVGDRCVISGNDFSENGNGYTYDSTNPTGGNTVGAGLMIGQGVQNCVISGNMVRHNHLEGIGVNLFQKDRHLLIANNVVSTNGLANANQQTRGVFGNFYGTNLSNNQIVNETYGEIASIGRTGNVVTVTTAIAVNYHVGYTVRVFGSPNGTFNTNCEMNLPACPTVTNVIAGNAFTFTEAGPDVPVENYEAGLQPLGQVFSATGGFNQNNGILVNNCNESEIVGNTVRNGDFSNVYFIQFLPGSPYIHCHFASDTTTIGDSTLSASGKRDLYLTSDSGGSVPLIPTVGGLVVDVPSVQVVVSACTTAATVGATCTVTIAHEFDDDISFMLSTADAIRRNRTTCSLDGGPVAQTGNPIILKTVQTSPTQATVTIGSFDGQAAGGGTLRCYTNFNY